MTNAQWRTVALGKVTTLAATWNPSRAPSDETFTYIDLSAVDQAAKQIIGAREIACAEAPSRARQLVARDDVLVATVRPNLNGVARVPEALDGATASTGFCVLRANQAELDGGYLFHWVKSPDFVADMVRKATGASYPAVSDRIIFDSAIPLPPLEEQRRIAEVLDRAEALRAKRRAALAQLDSLTQSLFLDLFGDPVANPKKLPTKPLTEACYCYSGGTPSKANTAFWTGDLPWFSAKDLKQPDLFDSQDHISREVPKVSTLKLLPANTVGIVVRGMILAHSFPVSVFRVPCTINQDLKALLPNLPLDAQFLAACLRCGSSYALQQVSEAGHGTKRLDSEGLSKIPILLPPIEQQREFARRVAAVEKLKTAQRASLAELDALFATLQHRAFTGDLFS